MASKTDLMRLVERGLVREVFSHTECGDFDVTSMRQYARLYVEPKLAAIADVLAFIEANRDYEKARVNALKPGEYLHDPALAVQYRDGSTLLIDGTHRILRRHKEGLDDFPVWVVGEMEIIRPNTTGRVDLEWGKFNVKDGRVIPRAGE